MPMTQDEVMTAIMTSETLADLESVLVRLAEDHGFTAATYADVTRVPLPDEAPPYFKTTLPPAFLAGYLANDLPSFDPIA